MKYSIKTIIVIFCIILFILYIMWLGFMTYRFVCDYKKINELQQELNNIKQDVLYLDEEYKTLWLNIDALSEDYTLLFNEIYRSDKDGR